MHQLGLRLLAALCMAVWTAGGLAIATNFRGFTVWHARWSVSMFRQPTEARVAFQVALERFIGMAFVVTGVIGFIASFFAPFRTS
jgi:hypothetical protein